MNDFEPWHPLNTAECIQLRAELYQKIRGFMRQRDIMEVDTPVLSHYGTTDPYIQSLKVRPGSVESEYYLHTSPEFCMKRLLAAGSGSIYQIAHVFRDEEQGKQHLTEFTMLEWYRVGYDYYQLMGDIADLLEVIGLERPDKLTYAAAFEKTLDVDPHTVSIQTLADIAKKGGWQAASNDRHELLDFIFSIQVLGQLNSAKPLIIHDYPECMAALATLKAAAVPVSERFELFINGMEIANGFNELCDATEQYERFTTDLNTRRLQNKDEPKVDINFLDAMKAGLPKSAGVAVGLDRLIMVLANLDDINKVCSFTLKNN